MDRKEYRLIFYLRRNPRSYVEDKHDIEFTKQVSKNLGNAVVDEILRFRETGFKSAYMMLLEDEFDGYFRRESSGVIYLEEITVKKIRKEGGIFKMIRENKEKNEH